MFSCGLMSSFVVQVFSSFVINSLFIVYRLYSLHEFQRETKVLQIIVTRRIQLVCKYTLSTEKW